MQVQGIKRSPILQPMVTNILFFRDLYTSSVHLVFLGSFGRFIKLDINIQLLHKLSTCMSNLLIANRISVACNNYCTLLIATDIKFYETGPGV